MPDPFVSRNCRGRRTFALCCDILARKQAHDATCDAVAANRSSMPQFVRRYFLEASAGQHAHAASALATFTAGVVTATAKTQAEDRKGNMSPARVVYWFGVLAKLVEEQRYCAPMSDFLCGLLQVQVSAASSAVEAGENNDKRVTTVFQVLASKGVIGLLTACRVGRQCLLEWVGRERWLSEVEHELRARVSTEGVLLGSHVGVCEWVDVMLSAWEREYQRRMDTFEEELDSPPTPARSHSGGSKSKRPSQCAADHIVMQKLVKTVAPDLSAQTLERYAGDEFLHCMHDATTLLKAAENLSSIVPW